MSSIARCLGLALTFFFPLHVEAQAVQDAVLSFQFNWAALHQPGYTFALHPDGRGSYTQEGSVSAPIQLSSTSTAKLFAQAKELSYFSVICAAKMKGVADTGVKVLSYKGSDGTGSCTYNFTQNQTVQAVTETFQALAMTLDEGRKLESEHRYDRLALFAEMSHLSDLVKDGRAREMGLITEVLRSLADDPDVLEKVRSKAATLLALSESGK